MRRGMPKRKIVRIDGEQCTGCGECIPSCAEGAIRIVDGKARLVADNLCDGLGACLGDCPEGAIMIEEREADAYDEEAVAADLHPHAGGCPGSRVMTFERPAGSAGETVGKQPSELRQWPVQLHLVSPRAARKVPVKRVVVGLQGDVLSEDRI